MVPQNSSLLPPSKLSGHIFLFFKPVGALGLFALNCFKGPILAYESATSTPTHASVPPNLDYGNVLYLGLPMEPV